MSVCKECKKQDIGYPCYKCDSHLCFDCLNKNKKCTDCQPITKIGKSLDFLISSYKPEEDTKRKYVVAELLFELLKSQDPKEYVNNILKEINHNIDEQ